MFRDNKKIKWYKRISSNNNVFKFKLFKANNEKITIAIEKCA